MRKKQLINVIVVVAVILAVGGVAAFKLQEKGALGTSSSETSSSEANSGSHGSLEVTSFDIPDLAKEGKPIIFDLGSEGCGPCRAMFADMMKAHEELDSMVTIRFLDVWARPAAAQDVPINSIPAQLFFNADGTPYQGSKNSAVPLIEYRNKQTGELVYTIHSGRMNFEQFKAMAEEMGQK